MAESTRAQNLTICEYRMHNGPWACHVMRFGNDFPKSKSVGVKNCNLFTK
jgi:hypothetical protein